MVAWLFSRLKNTTCRTNVMGVNIDRTLRQQSWIIVVLTKKNTRKKQTSKEKTVSGGVISVLTIKVLYDVLNQKNQTICVTDYAN